MGVQGALQNRVHPQRPRQSQLAKLVVPALEKIAKDASWRKHAKLIEECQSVLRWFADPSAVARQSLLAEHNMSKPVLLPSSPVSSSDRADEVRVQPSESPLEAGRTNGGLLHLDEESVGRSFELRNETGGNATADVQGAEGGIHESGKAQFTFRVNESGGSHTGTELGATSATTPVASNSGTKSSGGTSMGSDTSTLTEEVSSATGVKIRREHFDAAESPVSTVTTADSFDVSHGTPLNPVVLFDEGDEGFTLEEADFILRPLRSACGSISVQLAEPALDAFLKVLTHKHLRGEVDGNRRDEQGRILGKVLDSVCQCAGLAEESSTLELLLIRTLLSAVCSTYLTLHGDAILMSLRTCIRMATRSNTPLYQATAKAAVAQIVAATLARMEGNSVQTYLEPVVVANLVSLTERSSTDWLIVQAFVSKAVEEGREVGNTLSLVPAQRPRLGLLVDSNVGKVNSDSTDAADLFRDNQDMRYMKRRMDQAGVFLHSCSAGSLDLLAEERESTGNKVIISDAFNVLEELFTVAMKNPYKGAAVDRAELDPVALREKTLALELLCFVLESTGPVLLASRRFMDMIRHTLCLSLLENSRSALMTVFQLSCSIFLRLLDRFRPILRPEIGEFFPLFVSRPLESREVDFAQKTIILRLVESICADPQILVDMYVNYDCDVESDSLFEGLVLALVHTAQGKSLGGQLSTVQELSLKVASIKCIAALLGGLDAWVLKQIQIAEGAGAASPRPSETGSESSDVTGGLEKGLSDGESLEMEGVGAMEAAAREPSSEAATFEQRKQYKREFQEGISLFNRNPRKGLAALVSGKKIGASAQEMAQFLRTQAGLNKAKIGEYLGEGDEEATAVMQAYVDSFNLEGVEFDEAIRLILKDFRLPGEAQKIERILERFAERYFECNPNLFSNPVTAHVLAYSVIMLNTDAHNPAVKAKMSKAEFVKNNSGIDDGRDLPLELLSGLYERIVSNEIKMREDPLMAAPKAAKMVRSSSKLMLREPASSRRVHNAADVLRLMRENFQARTTGKSELPYYSPSDYEIVRAMLESVWTLVLAALSLDWPKGSAELARPYLLEGFRFSVGLTSRLGMPAQRDAFFSALSHHTMQSSKASRKGWKSTKAKVVKKTQNLMCCTGPGLDYQALTPHPRTPFLDWCTPLCNFCSPKAT